MGFKNRLLQEDNFNYGQISNGPTLGQKIKEGAKNNWGKLLGAGALGAAAATGMAIHNDDFNDTLNQMHELDNKDQLWNHVLDKGKQGLEHLKTATGVSGDNSDAGGDSGSWSSRVGGGGSSGATDLDKLKATALKYGAGNDGLTNFVGRNTIMPENDIEISQMNPTDIAKLQRDLTNEQMQTAQQYKELLNKSLKDGVISPDEQAQLDELKDKLDNPADMGLYDKFMGLFYGSDKVQAEQFAERQLRNSMEWAKQNNLEFLLNPDKRDDLAFFRDVQARFGYIPKPLLPLYQDTLRRVAG